MPRTYPFDHFTAQKPAVPVSSPSKKRAPRVQATPAYGALRYGRQHAQPLVLYQRRKAQGAKRKWVAAAPVWQDAALAEPFEELLVALHALGQAVRGFFGVLRQIAFRGAT